MGTLTEGVAPFVKNQVVMFDGEDGPFVAIRVGATWGWQVAIHGFWRITDAEVRSMLLSGTARIIHDASHP